MNLAVQILPLRLYGQVALHLGHGVSPLEAVTLELVDEVVENQGVGTLRTVLGQYAYQQQVNDVRLVPLQHL